MINPVTWRKYNPFQISYKTFMTTLRNPTIPVIDRKQYFFIHCDPYMDYISTPERQSDLTFISTLLSSTITPKITSSYTQTKNIDENKEENVIEDPDEEDEEDEENKNKNENDKKRQIECIL